MGASPAGAQVAGSATVGVAVAEMTQVVNGWSAKKSILGKPVFNDAGEKVGKVQDLIISPDKNLSYLIVGAGGFIGIGRHDVAVPTAQIHAQDGKLVWSGATKDAVKTMPAFVYAEDTSRRDQFVAKADQDIAQAKEKTADLERRAAAASGDAKVKLDQQVTALKQDLNIAEDKLAATKRAGVREWKEIANDVRRAIVRLQQRLEHAAA
jgi:sporulation protein YlmC with PRC-barrel domain